MTVVVMVDDNNVVVELIDVDSNIHDKEAK